MVETGMKKIHNLVVSGGRSKFAIPEFPRSEAPNHPDEPDWTEAVHVESDTVGLLAVLSQLTAQDQASKMGGMCGLRLTEEWVGAVTHQSLAVFFHAGLVKESVTIPDFLFSGVKEAVDLRVEDNRVWVKGKETGQVRWA